MFGNRCTLALRKGHTRLRSSPRCLGRSLNCSACVILLFLLFVLADDIFSYQQPAWSPEILISIGQLLSTGSWLAKDTGDSRPFLSYETLRDACDLRFDSDSTPPSASDLRAASGSRTLRIFLETDHIVEFDRDVLRRIRGPFVLVSSNNHDFAAPFISSARANESRAAYERVLASPGLKAWMATNLLLSHPKLIPLPLMNKWNWYSIRFGEEPRAPVVGILRRRASNPNLNFRQPKPYLVSVSFGVHSTDAPVYAAHRGERRRLKAQLDTWYRAPKESFIRRYVWQLANIAWLRYGKSGWYYVAFDNYLRELGRHKFTLSPPGNGADCHRTWEALMVGSIPIVLDVPSMSAMYDGLPVLQVKSWTDLTPEFLDAQYTRIFARQDYDFSKLFAKYWLEMLNGF